MMDLGAHPMYMARWILGKPARITSTFNTLTGRAAEDNAVCVIEFENKAVAIVETSFVSTHSPGCLELYGTEGTLLIGGPDRGVKIMSNKIESTVPGWVTPSELRGVVYKNKNAIREHVLFSCRRFAAVN